MRIESMKGKWCPYKPIICQEGYCQDCQVYLDHKETGNKYETGSGVNISSKLLAVSLDTELLPSLSDEEVRELFGGKGVK